MSLTINTKTTGFRSPAEAYVSKRLDLNDLIVNDVYTTFYFKYAGESKWGVNTGDVLVVDRSCEAEEGDLVLVSGEKIELEIYKKGIDIWGVITWTLSQRKKSQS